jgi:hypothetical protein
MISIPWTKGRTKGRSLKRWQKHLHSQYGSWVVVRVRIMGGVMADMTKHQKHQRKTISDLAEGK